MTAHLAPSKIPAELRAIDRWLVWVDAKKAKLPGKKAPVNEAGDADKHWQDSRLSFRVASKRRRTSSTQASVSSSVTTSPD